MKAPQQHGKPADADAKAKPGNKIQCLKPGKYSKKSSGNVVPKCVRGDAQSHTDNKITGTKIQLKGGSFMVAPFSNSTNLLAKLPNHSGKMKLQFFPIDEAIQTILQQENHNPYLELTLAPRKKVSSIVQHLNTKWGRSSCAKGDLMLFPYSARLDSIADSEKWTLKDSCTAGDVYAAVGSPSTFRLRYGWFEPILKQQSSVASLPSVHSAEKTIVDRPSDPPSSQQEQMVNLSEFPANFARRSVESTPEQTVSDNQSKVTPLSWIDCISNISFGALLSEVVPSQDSKQPPSQSILQQLPATCDSFDAAIASLIRQQQTNQPKVSNPSLWDAEETCHAFPSRKQTSVRGPLSAPSNSSALASSMLGAIPESDADGDQQCCTEGRKEEPIPPVPCFGNNENVKPDVSMVPPESTGEPELGAFRSRLLNGTDSLGLSGLLANSLDAFPNFSVS
ncbi:TSL-kinase interacting protein 1-like isoform X1 [Lolium rigidum]|uniref:TSL-kinase interacting protein 1-like isoform X1 n=1 Tax=Lolium rigidum TaxID=89674 RepID=UPI001F5DCFD2|nr:TSL-kinase interacting protein 1-like isoform X1 [Lolium rigidum]XP_047055438.1 TSL-kinase interacting protein 1-like isoform X1 [Lolium rigidum]